MNWKTDDRPARRGWAPGEYTNLCCRCGDNFIGDKRAMTCADCAYSLPEEPPRLSPEEIELAAFEAWWLSKGHAKPLRGITRCYSDNYVQWAWEAWLGRAALSENVPIKTSQF